ncbi:transketolase, partial [bacterium]|nr:transketolase [bacterium]
ETTTGPLGQGFTNSVGMAIAEKMCQARLDDAILNHRVYTFCGDGDMMEGITSEAASLAGHLHLDNLIAFYDSNKITIEGATDLAFSENVALRFQAYGWETIEIDGHNHEEIATAIKKAQAIKEKPSLIICRTTIGKGAPTMAGTAKIHGSPLGDDEIAMMKKDFGWPEETFYIPENVKAVRENAIKKGTAIHSEWKTQFETWQKNNPEKAALWQDMQTKKVPADLAEQLCSVIDDKPLATRAQSGKIIQKLAELVPSVVGGSADLAPSNNTFIKNAGSIQADDFSGKNFHFGIREHAMGGIINGVSLYGAFAPFGGTFLVFSDYMRGSVRLSAIMKQQVVYVFTHDSIFVGEDGPTHQPVEHMAALSLIPNVTVIRPADGLETAAAWIYAIQNTTGPTVLALTRQKLAPVHQNETFDPKTVSRGGFVLSDTVNADVCLIASGSEVNAALEAKTLLEVTGTRVRIVSMPSLKLFRQQPLSYQQEVIPAGMKKVSVEAGVTDMWYAVIGTDGLAIGLDQFGASAPADTLAAKYGFTGPAIAERIRKWIK